MLLYFCINGAVNLNVKEKFEKETITLYGVISKCRKNNLRYCHVVNFECVSDVFNWVGVTSKITTIQLSRSTFCIYIHSVFKFYITIECRMNIGCLTK